MLAIISPTKVFHKSDCLPTSTPTYRLRRCQQNLYLLNNSQTLFA